MKKVIVTVNPEADLAAVVRLLARHGLRHPQALEVVSLVHGEAPESALPRMRQVPGVVDVSLEGVVQLDPIENPLAGP